MVQAHYVHTRQLHMDEERAMKGYHKYFNEVQLIVTRGMERVISQLKYNIYRHTIMKTCPTPLAAPSSIKLGHRGQTTQERIGGSCSIVKLVPRSTSLLTVVVVYSGKCYGCGIYILRLEKAHIATQRDVTMTFLLSLTYAIAASSPRPC